MKTIEQNDPAPEDNDDFDDLPNVGGIPADTDFEEGDDTEEGDEEKDDGSDLPPAMPPAV